MAGALMPADGKEKEEDMRKLVTGLSALGLVFMLAACDRGGEEQAAPAEEQAPAAEQAAPAEEAAPATEAAEEATEEAAPAEESTGEEQSGEQPQEEPHGEGH